MKRIVLIALIAVLCVNLCGCNPWLDGEYYSVTPHRQENQINKTDALEVASYSELRDVLTELVEDGTETAVIYLTGLDQDDLDQYMAMATMYVTGTNAIGAYAVDKVAYEVGANTGRTAIAVNITYNQKRSEILRIKKTATMEEALQHITEALEDCEASVVVRVGKYETTDFTQLIQDYMDTYPELCMEMPQVTVATYPERGFERVIELTFTYQTSRESLRSMQGYVMPVFKASDLNVSGEDEQSTKFSRIYSFLMERNDYQIETSITPSYSLLRHGVGDSKAFATVYAAMCRRAGLECLVVSGTRAGEPWVWNMICEDGAYYHVDLLQSSSVGALQRMTQDQMTGYVWDYSAYPDTEVPIEADGETEVTEG